MHVCTYICIVKLEEAIQTKNFTSEKQRAVLNLMYTTYLLKTHIGAAMKRFDLTMEQYNVLRILKGKHPQCMCVKDIAGRMIERSSNVPRIADRLEAKKLIKRYQSEEDKRHTSLSLTEKGISVLQQSLSEIEKIDHELSFLTDGEVNQLNSLLEKININIH